MQPAGQGRIISGSEKLRSWSRHAAVPLAELRTASRASSPVVKPWGPRADDWWPRIGGRSSGAGLSSDALGWPFRPYRRRVEPCRAKESRFTSVTSVEGEEDGEEEAGFLDKVSKVLRDFGIGRRSVWEGGVGTFVLGGAVLTFWLFSWARGSQLRKGRPYQATVVFPQACGITVGTPVRIRGVPVGSALNVTPRLDGVDVQIEVMDDGIVIPLNSIVEANQSGLIAEPFVDVTPQLPLPEVEAGPLSSDCEGDGKIVCHRGRIQGEQGVSLDDLVYICTKIARQMDAQGVDSMFKAAESLSEALDIAQPLILQAAGFVEEMTPLLADLRSGGLVSNLEALTKSVAEAASDIRMLQKAVFDDENVDAMRGGIKTLTQTLQNVESIAGDMSVFTGDSKVMGNLKSLIGALSRIVDE